MCLVREISKETQNKTKVQKGKQLPAFPRLAWPFLTISPMFGIETVLVVRLWKPSAKSIWDFFRSKSKSEEIWWGSIVTSVIVLLSFAPRGPTMQFLLDTNLIAYMMISYSRAQKASPYPILNTHILLNKLASSVDAIAISKIWNITHSPTDWLTGWPG